jgi:hypothetical protein
MVVPVEPPNHGLLYSDLGDSGDGIGSAGSANPAATSRRQSRGLLVGGGLGVVALALILLLSLCGGDADPGMAEQAAATVDTSNAATLPPETAKTSPPDSTALDTTVLELDAGAMWSDVMEGLPAGSISSSIGTVENEPFVATADPTTSEVVLWSFVQDDWTRMGALYIEDLFNEVEPEVALVDANSDGSDEVLATYVRGQDYWGSLLWSDRGDWVEAASEQSLALREGTVSGYRVFCLPDCATDPGIEVRISWNGVSFESQTVDTAGNPILVVDSEACSSYFEVGSIPFGRCSKGPLVANLQSALADLGYWYNSVPGEGPVTDGYFGPDTATALRIYQHHNRLRVTGETDGNWYFQLIEGYNGEFGD